MTLGTGLGFVPPPLDHATHSELSSGGVGLILMVYPPLEKVNSGQLPAVFRNWRLLGVSLAQNWLIGPTVMFTLAIVFFSGLVPGLPARPEFFLGLVFIGMTRCIVMVLLRNELAAGSPEYTADLGVFNSVFQILTVEMYIENLKRSDVRRGGPKGPLVQDKRRVWDT